MEPNREPTRTLTFKADTPDGEALLAWWNGLADDRGERARLRRCGTLAEVYFTRAYSDLLNALTAVRGGERLGRDGEEGVALVAALLAHAEGHDGGAKLAKQMATPHDRPPVSELRFRRLLQARDRQALFTYLVRVVRLLDRRLNLRDLARGAYWWNEFTRREWALTYFGAER